MMMMMMMMMMIMILLYSALGRTLACLDPCDEENLRTFGLDESRDLANTYSDIFRCENRNWELWTTYNHFILNKVCDKIIDFVFFENITHTSETFGTLSVGNGTYEWIVYYIRKHIVEYSQLRYIWDEAGDI